MNYQICGLSPEPFLGLYGLSDGALAERQARRCRANARPGFPDRIEIRDVDPGNDVLLVNYVHQAGSTPYRASHAVFVREGAERTAVFLNEVPEALKVRSLSVRAFDADHWMVDADICEGRELDGLVCIESPGVGRRKKLKTDALMDGEITRRRRRARFRQVAGARAHDATDAAQLGRNQSAIGQRPDAQRQIHVVFEEIDDAIAEDKPNVDLPLGP